MSGLSYLSNGGQGEAEDTSDVTVQVKPAAQKGRMQMPTLATNVPAGQSTLEAMEEMYQEMLARQTGLSGFLEAAKDAQAWWTPGGAQRSQALGRRGEARERQAADLFNMRSQIAQYKSALEDQARFEKEKPALLGQSSSMSGIDLEPHEIAMLGRMKTRADFNKLLEKFVMERTKGLSQPGAAESKYPILLKDESGNYTIPNEVSLSEQRRLIRSGEGIMPGVTPPAPKAATTTPPPAAATTTPPPAAAPVTPPPAAAVITPPPAAAVTTPPPAAAPVTPPPAAKPVRYTFEELSPQQLQTMQAKGKEMGLLRDDFSRPDAAKLFNALPVDKRRAMFESLGADESVQPTKVAAAPTMADVTEPATGPITEPTQVAQAARRPPTMPEIRAEQELQKQRSAERAKTEAEDERTHNDASRTAVDRERTASEIITIVSKNPEVVGVLQKPGVAAALATLIKTGISAPGGHSIGVKELDEVLFKGQANLTQEQVNARDRLRSLLNKTSLNAATIMKGQGAVTEFERQLLQNMVGSLDNTPENLVKIQKTLMENAKTRREIDSAFKKSRMAWGDFVKTDQYQSIQNAYDNRLRAIEEERITFGVPGRPGQAAPRKVQPFTDPKEEEAYQKWKRDQLKKR